MAIAFDAATNGSNTTGTSLTFSHTVTGSNTFLIVGGLGSTASDKWTGVTYNGVAMTRSNAGQMSPGDRWCYLYYLVGPATGAHNVVISSSSDFISGNAASYTGVSQTGQPDASVMNNISSGTPNTNTLTTVADNCWHVMVGGNASGTPTAGTGSTIRATANGNMALFDGNAAVTPAGSNSIGMTGMNSSFGSNTIGISIKPYIASAIKTVNGLAVASVKTVEGLAIASVKTINGLA